jgi:hypothetical protein
LSFNCRGVVAKFPKALQDIRAIRIKWHRSILRLIAK